VLALSAGGSYDVTSLWWYSDNSVFREDTGVYLRPGI